jgi:hypothetical protein
LLQTVVSQAHYRFGVLAGKKSVDQLQTGQCALWKAAKNRTDRPVQSSDISTATNAGAEGRSLPMAPASPKINSDNFQRKFQAVWMPVRK